MCLHCLTHDPSTDLRTAGAAAKLIPRHIWPSPTYTTSSSVYVSSEHGGIVLYYQRKISLIMPFQRTKWIFFVWLFSGICIIGFFTQLQLFSGRLFQGDSKYRCTSIFIGCIYDSTQNLTSVLTVVKGLFLWEPGNQGFAFITFTDLVFIT